MELFSSSIERNGVKRERKQIGDNMEVSVIIPNFNGIAFLDSVLGSLEGQTLKNFEVILVDKRIRRRKLFVCKCKLSMGAYY